MAQSEGYRETAPMGFDSEGWPLPEVRSAMMENFARSWTKHWVAVIVIFIVSLVLIIGPSLLITPRWEGHANALINEQSLPNLSVTGNAAVNGTDVETLVANLIEVAKSRPFLKDVVIDLRLDEYFREKSENPTWRDRIKTGIARIVTLRFLRKGGEPDWVERAVDELQADWVSAVPLEKTSMVPLLIYGDDPDKTVQVGDTMLAHLQDFMDQMYREAIEGQLPNLEARIESLEAQIAADDQAVTDLLISQGTIDPTAFAENALQGLADLEQDQATLALNVQAANEVVASLREELAQNPQTLDLVRQSDQEREATANTAESLRTRLATKRAERDGLLAYLSPNAKEIRTINAEIGSLEEQISTMADTGETTEGSGRTTSAVLNPRQQAAYQGWIDASRTLVQLQARQAGLSEAISTLRDLQRDAVRASQSLDRLRRQQSKSRNEYDTLYSRLVEFETTLRQPRVFNSIQIPTAAWVKDDREPDFPNMLLVGVIGLAVAFVTALVLPVGYDYVNQTLLSSRQASAVPGVRVVAAAPRSSLRKMYSSASA